MTDRTWALVDASHVVVNVVVWDGDPGRWTPPPGVTAIEIDSVTAAEPGGTYDPATQTFAPNLTPRPTPNSTVVRAAVKTAMVVMQTIIDTPPATLAQAQTAIVAEARAIRRLIRVALADYTATD